MGVNVFHVKAGSDSIKLMEEKINPIKSKFKGKSVILYVETPANPNNVMVDLDGIVKIRDKLRKDGNNVKGVCWVYVTPVVNISSIKINSSEIYMLTGKSRQLTVRVRPATNTDS